MPSIILLILIVKNGLILKEPLSTFIQKKISVYGVEDNIIKEIHKFPFPFQRLIVKEACAVMDRIEEGKSALGSTSLECYCLFQN